MYCFPRNRSWGIVRQVTGTVKFMCDICAVRTDSGRVEIGRTDAMGSGPREAGERPERAVEEADKAEINRL